VRIRINQEPVDVTFEDERTLGDVFDGIRAWLQETGFEISAAQADGSELRFGDREPWRTIEMDRVELLDLAAELRDPVGEVRETISALRGLVPGLNNVSVLLQTGRDREAMETVIRFTEESQTLLKLLARLQHTGRLDPAAAVIDGTTVERFFSDLNRILTELIEAFEAKDSVLIGDLLEYEVTPRLEGLERLTEALE
jgi:hypothetical protein